MRDKITRRDFLGLAAAAGVTTAVANAADRFPHAEPMVPQGRLVIGGGNTQNIFKNLEKWHEYLKDRKVICVTSGSAFTTMSPEQQKIALAKSMARNRELYAEKGLKLEDLIFISSREDAKSERIAGLIRNPKNKIFFDAGAGDQDTIRQALADTPVERALFKRFLGDPDFLVFSTSASAMVLTEHMIDADDKTRKLEVRDGLGWLKQVMIDTHVHDEHESRIGRTMEAVRQHPDCTALAIDSGTAIEFQSGKGVVHGRGNVYVVRAGDYGKPEHELEKFAPGGKSISFENYINLNVSPRLYAEAKKQYQPEIVATALSN